jgi:hypothetical protein
MRELLLRAMLYRAWLGEPGALDAAWSLSAQLDNPAVGSLLDSVLQGRAVPGVTVVPTPRPLALGAD